MFEATINGITLRFETMPSLFSHQKIDAGTRAMLQCAAFTPEDKVLDLGCGYGPVGIYAAKLIGEQRVTMCDIDPLAVQLSKANAVRNGVPDIRVLQSDGFCGIGDAGYTLILSNPPYHTDFSVAKAFIEKGFNRLILGGRMMMVTKRRDWYRNKMTSIFGGVTVREMDGYFVMTAEKRGKSYAKK